MKRWFLDILLFMLILSSLVMVCQIWFGSYISPEKYTETVENAKAFLRSPISFFSKNDSGTFSENIKVLLKPEKIVANRAADRLELTASDARFDNIKFAAENMLAEMLVGDAKITEKSTVTEEEYFLALKSKSLYVSYGNCLDSRLVSMSISGLSDSKITGDISELSDIIISFNDNVLNNVYVYIKDSGKGNIIKYSVEYNKARLDNSIEEIFDEKSPSAIPSYSFELNFHKGTEGSPTKVLFAPTILLDVSPKMTDCIKGSPIYGFADNQSINSDAEDGLLRAFKINPLTMRKIVDVSGSAVFVENYGTLIIDPRGIIDFKAVEGKKGISLTDTATLLNYDIYKATTHAVDFISNLCAIFPGDMLDNLHINCDLVSDHEKTNRYTLKFDYFIDGAPVFVQSDGKVESAIEIVIENGNLLSYRQHLRKYQRNENSSVVINSINAADKIVENVPEDELPVYIKNLGTCFVDNGEDELKRTWRFEFSNHGDIILSN